MPVLPLPLTAVFADLPAPRQETRNKLHALSDILAFATCAMIAGAETWDDIAEYGQAKEGFLRRNLRLARAPTIRLGVLIHDGYTGSRLDRPTLDRLRDVSRESGLSLVAVGSPGSLARRYAYQTVLLKGFHKAR